MSALVEVRALRKQFGSVLAVDGVSFSVERGQVVGFLGPNGAGKSTTMKMITGFLPPTSGTASVCGVDVSVAPVEAKRQMGYLPEGSPLYDDMTPESFLDFIGRARSMPTTTRRRAIVDAIDRLELGEVLHRKIDTLSKGFRRRVGFAQAIMHDPDVLILDEPTDGLDPNQKHQVRELIRSMGDSKAIIISTHILEEVEAVCDRAIIIDHGQVLQDSTPSELLRMSPDYNALRVTVGEGDAEALKTALIALPSVSSVEQIDADGGLTRIIVRPRQGANIAGPVASCVGDSGIAVRSIEELGVKLDDVFRRITMGSTK